MKPISTFMFIWIGIILASVSRHAPASPGDIIICGSGGDEEYQQKFAAWGQRLRTALIEQLDRPADEVVLMCESANGPTSSALASDLESIKAVLEKASRELGPDDDMHIYLIGHGSYWQGISRFHIPGPDLTADDLAELLAPIRVQRLVLINGTSTSAGFINTLSRPGRVIVTATKSVEQRNATQFMEYFIQALEDGSADQNRDERISVLEASRQAATLTDAHYVGEGLIATEHALIDDNGDGFGARLGADRNEDFPGSLNQPDEAASADGALAARQYLKDFSFPPGAPRPLIDQYLSLLSRIEDLKAQKAGIENDAYYADLEILLIEAAQAHRQIRSFLTESSSVLLDSSSVRQDS